MTVTIDDRKNLEKFLQRLTDPKHLTEFAQNVGMDFGHKAEAVLSDYPSRPRYPLKWASDKQRRWYFASRRARGLPIPYERLTDPMSDQLGMNWETQRTNTGAVVGNRVPYAAYVQGWQTQSEMHKATGWTTERKAAERVFERDMADIINRQMRKFFKGLESGLGV